MAIAFKSVGQTVSETGSATIAATSAETSATVVGDLVVVIHTNNFYALSNMPTPTATGSPTLTAVTGGTVDLGTDQGHLKSWTYVANTGGAQTVTVTETGSADEEKTLAVWVLSGADTSTPIDIAGGSGSTTTADPFVLSSVTTTTADAFLIGHVMGYSGSDLGFDPPAGMTERYDASGASFLAHSGASVQLVASGATGTKAFDPGGVHPWVGVLIAVRTASAGGPPSDANQWTPKRFAGPVPRVFRTGIRAPIQLMGDKATPFDATHATVTAVAIVTTAAAPAPTLQTGSTVAAVAIAAPVALPAPTVQTGSTVAATSVATSSTLPAPALNTGSTVAATAIDTAVSIPPPAVVVPAVIDPHQFIPTRAPMFYDLGRATQVLGDRTSPVSASDATVSAVAIATTTALPAPALQTGSTVAATDVVTTTALPAPTLQTGSTVTAVTVTTTTVMSAPSIIAGSAADSNQFLPGRAPMFYDIGKATQLQGDRTIIDATVAATVINTVTVLDAPTVTAVAGTDQYQAGPQIAGMFLAPELASFQLQGDSSTGAPASSDATVTPPSIATAAALPAPTLQTGSTVSATTLATVTALPAPVVQTGSTVAGTTIATVTSLPAPSIQTAGNITVAATSIATVTALPAPSVQQSQTVSATAVATVTSITAPAITAETAVSPATIATVTALPAPTVQTGQTVSAVTIATVTALPTPTVEGLFTGIKGRGQGGGSSSAGGTAYPPGGTGMGSVYPRSDGGIIGQAG